MTSNLTREQTQQIIDAADAVISALAGTNDEVHKDDTDKMVRLWDGLNDKYAPPEVVRELARMALAAMDSEPVAFIDKQWTLVYFVPPMSMGLKIGDKLYRHAQQPVAPDESYKQLSELYHTQEKRLFKIAQRIKGPTFDKYSHLSSQAIDVLEAAIFGEDDTCRAAMLQAGNSPVIPEGWQVEAERLAEMHGMSFVLFRHGEAPQCADPTKVVISFTDKGLGHDTLPAAPQELK